MATKPYWMTDEEWTRQQSAEFKRKYNPNEPVSLTNIPDQSPEEQAKRQWARWQLSDTWLGDQSNRPTINPYEQTWVGGSLAQPMENNVNPAPKPTTLTQNKAMAKEEDPAASIETKPKQYGDWRDDISGQTPEQVEMTRLENERYQSEIAKVKAGETGNIWSTLNETSPGGQLRGETLPNPMLPPKTLPQNQVIAKTAIPQPFGGLQPISPVERQRMQEMIATDENAWKLKNEEWERNNPAMAARTRNEDAEYRRKHGLPAVTSPYLRFGY